MKKAAESDNEGTPARTSTVVTMLAADAGGYPNNQNKEEWSYDPMSAAHTAFAYSRGVTSRTL